MVLIFISLMSMMPAPHGVTFQKGIITFTFDNGYSGVNVLAAPILKDAGIKATAFVYPSGLTGLSNHMVRQQITDLQNNYGWEIGSEGMTQNGLAACTDSNCYNSEVVQSKQNMTAAGWTVSSFAYPTSTVAKNSAIRTLVVDNYLGARDTTSGRTGLALNSPGVDLYGVISNDVKGNTTAAIVQSWIDQAVSSKSWLVLNFKKIVSCSSISTPKSTEFGDCNLQTIVQYVQGKVSGGALDALTFAAAVNTVKGGGGSGTGTQNNGNNFVGLLTIPLIVVGVALIGGIGLGVHRFNSKKRRRTPPPTAASSTPDSKLSGTGLIK